MFSKVLYVSLILFYAAIHLSEGGGKMKKTVKNLQKEFDLFKDSIGDLQTLPGDLAAFKTDISSTVNEAVESAEATQEVVNGISQDVTNIGTTLTNAFQQLDAKLSELENSWNANFATSDQQLQTNLNEVEDTIGSEFDEMKLLFENGMRESQQSLHSTIIDVEQELSYILNETSCCGSTQGSLITQGDTLFINQGSNSDGQECALNRRKRTISVTSQWVSSVTGFSSEWTTSSYGTNRILGEPNVYPSYGDNQEAWCPSTTGNANEFLELEFAEEVFVTGVAIYETLHAGAVKAISGLDGNGQWQTLWSTNQAQVITVARMFEPVLEVQNFHTRHIRLDIDSTVSNNWVEIDAVRLDGTTEYVPDEVEETVEVDQWVSGVTGFSSEYNSNSWSANQIIGPPNVYPQYGDLSGTWAPQTIDANQFLEFEFTEEVYVTGIAIYETYNAGGVKAVKGLDGNGQWQTLWSTDDVQRIESSRIFEPVLQVQNFRTRHIRLDIDCSVANTWVEIDAVQLSGTNLQTDVGSSLEEFVDDFESLVNDNLFADVKFQIGSTSMYGHKAILCARSNVFRTMYCNDIGTAVSMVTVTIPDVDSESFLAFLHFAYTNKIPSNFPNAKLTELWSIADYFNMGGLKTLTCSLQNGGGDF